MFIKYLLQMCKITSEQERENPKSSKINKNIIKMNTFNIFLVKKSVDKLNFA